MQRRVLAMLVLALLLALVPTAARAKGASAATISGGGPGGLPGGPIDLKGDGEPGTGTDLANLAEAAGVFTVLFQDGSTAVLTAPPAGDRGPRYTITWIFPNGDGGADKVRQSVWPYAAAGPLTFMAPGQPVLGATTKGGWYRADDGLRLALIALGLPKRQPMAVDSRGRPTPGSATLPHRGAEPGTGSLQAAQVVGLLGVGLLVGVGAVVVAVRRRSGGSGAAAAR
jgi:hypothetical protein